MISARLSAADSIAPGSMPLPQNRWRQRWHDLWQRLRKNWQHALASSPVGKVFLVGAGPGDPELLTLKAARILASAEVVLYDRLVTPAILDLVPASALKRYVGKCSGDHHVSQTETERLMVQYARQGRQVVRLKGGDPFLFGRGGEEVQTLQRAGIAVDVVPGITAALGCGAYAGIPLTHRDYASSVLFLTGCDQFGALPASSVALARRDQTLVIYMGLARLPQLCASLQRSGLPADWPIALIAEGTTSQQRVLIGTLATVADCLVAHPLVSPTLVIVGTVVNLARSNAARTNLESTAAQCPMPAVDLQAL